MKQFKVASEQTQRAAYYHFIVKSHQNSEGTAFDKTALSATTYADNILATLVEVDHQSRLFIDENEDNFLITLEIFACFHATDEVVIQQLDAFLTIEFRCENFDAQEEFFLLINDVIRNFKHFVK